MMAFTLALDENTRNHTTVLIIWIRLEYSISSRFMQKKIYKQQHKNSERELTTNAIP